MAKEAHITGPLFAISELLESEIPRATFVWIDDGERNRTIKVEVEATDEGGAE